MFTKHVQMMLMLTFVLLATACSTPEQSLNRYKAEFLEVFDTASQIVGYAEDEESFKAQMTRTKQLFMHYDALFDIYNNYEGLNNLKTINDQAGIAPVVVDSAIIDLLELSKEYYRLSDGHVNVAFGSVLSIWHDYRERGIDRPQHAKLPLISELELANTHTDINDIVIDRAASTVFLKDPAMTLDVGAIAKGYGVERVAQQLLAESTDPHLLFSIGGNIRAVGSKPSGDTWVIGLQNPDLESEQQIYLRIDLRDKSLVTSGGYQRYYMVDGKRYHHIINRDSLMPADYFASVSVLTESSTLADALSTALFNMPYDEGRALVDRLEDVEALWIFKDMHSEMTKGFESHIVNE